MANLTEELEPPPVETYDDELVKVKQAANQISWTHVMGETQPQQTVALMLSKWPVSAMNERFTPYYMLAQAIKRFCSACAALRP